MSSELFTIPSPYKNPAASSKSAPGVRIVTATVCLPPPVRSLISIGSSVASVSGLTRILPSSTIRTRVLVLLARLALPEVFSSIRFSRSGSPQVYQRARVSMHGPCTARSDVYLEVDGTPERCPLPRGDRGEGRDEHPDPLQRTPRGTEDERPAPVRRRGRGDGGAAIARATPADRLHRQTRRAGFFPSAVAAPFRRRRWGPPVRVTIVILRLRDGCRTRERCLRCRRGQSCLGRTLRM